jgi:hypothetical protein
MKLPFPERSFVHGWECLKSHIYFTDGIGVQVECLQLKKNSIAMF